MTQGSNVYTDVATVASVYAVTTATVRQWCADGWIVGARKVGKQWRIPKQYETGQPEIKPPQR